MAEFEGMIGKLIQLTYTDLDGEVVDGIGKILYTLKNRAFVFQDEEDMRQMIVYNRHVMRMREVHTILDGFNHQENQLADPS
jgi:hypothetical protein